MRRRTSRQPQPEASDPRPRLAIGHVGLAAADVGRLASFYERIGMRKIVRLPGVAILELRGGTHRAISRGSPGRAGLDLMVDDLDETFELLAAAGAEPGRIRRAGPHRRFTATDPEGNALVVNPSHVTAVV